jgi:MATE family, multidrug efflux pump
MEERRKMLATENIKKLLTRLSTPAVVGMMVMALYNLVDTIFVGRGVGAFALAGLAITFPITMITMGIAQAIGFGGASIVSRNLGSDNIERADRTYGNVFLLAVGISFVLMFIGVLGARPLAYLFGATPAIIGYAVSYLRIVFLGLVFFTFAVSSNNIVRAEGNAKVAMITMLVSAGINLVLDPIFIFKFGWGVEGAAWATVIAQVFTAVYLAYYFFGGKSILKISFKHFRLERSIVKEIFAIGASSLSRMVSGSVVLILVFHSLGNYGGEYAIAVFGILNRILMFILMPLFGIAQGLQPIIGFNYGAKNYQRVHEAVAISLRGSTIIAMTCFLILYIFPAQIISIFNNDPQLISIGAKGMRIASLALGLIGLQVIGATLFQAIGKAFPAFILATSRQIIFLVPLLLILPLFFKLNGVWMSFPIADLLAAGLAAILISREMKNFVTES